MKLSRDERDWQDLAEMDPMWAVLSSRGKQHGGWDNEEFLSSGRTEIVGVIARADALGLPRRRGAALDFGCGADRLTRPLAECFESYVGVDISEEMLSNAPRERRCLQRNVRPQHRHNSAVHSRPRPQH